MTHDLRNAKLEPAGHHRYVTRCECGELMTWHEPTLAIHCSTQPPPKERVVLDG